MPDEGDGLVDVGMSRFYEYVMAELEAGKAYKKEETRFERWKREGEELGRCPWEPFASRAEWELARWLAKNVGQNQIEEFLKLEMVSQQSVPAHARLDITLFARFRTATSTPRASTSATNNWINSPHHTSGFSIKSLSSEIFSVKIFNH